MLSRFNITHFKRFDAYSRPLEELRVKTLSGAIVTVLAAIIMFALFLSELQLYLSVETKQELFVDTSRGQKMKINVDILFPQFPCEFLTIDTMDVSGSNQVDVDHDLYKVRLDENGVEVGESTKHELDTTKSTDPAKTEEQKKEEALRQKRQAKGYCGSCYGAETDDRKCCNTCDDVREAYRSKGWALGDTDNISQCKEEGFKDKIQVLSKEGCRLHGFLQVNKVAGNFHFAPGKSYTHSHVHVHDMQAFRGIKFNCTHHVKSLSFGDDFPGQVNPLDGKSVVVSQPNQMYTYYVKIVPTIFVPLNKTPVHTYQYSVTKYMKTAGSQTGESGLPGVFFMYELSPMLVKVSHKQRSLGHFLTSLCAIIGGVFTVAGLLDAFIFHSTRAVKQHLGKHT